jgi:hypothetical protein
MNSFHILAALLIGVWGFLLPLVVRAQQGPQTFADFIGLFIDFIRAALPLVMVLALLALIWGGAKFIRAAGSDDRAEGKYVLLWGSIALFVMVALWGIVGFIVDTFIGGT